MEKNNSAGDFEFEDCETRGGQRYSLRGEYKKKCSGQSGGTSASQSAGDPGDSLAAFTERLRDVCKDDGACHGQDREERIRAQAEHAVALAAELGCLRQPGVSWGEFLLLCMDAMIGTEHMVFPNVPRLPDQPAVRGPGRNRGGPPYQLTGGAMVKWASARGQCAAEH